LKRGIFIEYQIVNKLADKSISKEELLREVKQNLNLLPEVLYGLNSSKAAIRYGCGKVLTDLSEAMPDKLYTHIDFFIRLLDSNHRILTWNAMAIIANLTKVDTENRFDLEFDKYYSFLNDEYMVTVANVVANSAKIALAKPYLIERITQELLKVEKISITPHLTEECKRVISEKTVKFFEQFFEKIQQKERVLSFVTNHGNSPRKPLKKSAEKFLTKFK